MSIIAIPLQTKERAGKSLNSKEYVLYDYFLDNVLKKYQSEEGFEEFPDIKPEDYIDEYNLKEVAKKRKFTIYMLEKSLKRIEELEFIKILSWNKKTKDIKIEITLDEFKEKGGKS